MTKSKEKECQTLTIREAAQALGIGLNQCYEAAKSGEIPTIKIGKRVIVPRKPFERLLDGVVPTAQAQKAP